MPKHYTHDTQARLIGSPETESPYYPPNEPRRGKRGLIIFLAVLAALIGGLVAWFLIDAPLSLVSVNGRQEIVLKNATVGDLIAIDGSVARAGGGEPFLAEVNGTSTTDPSFVVPRGATVTISDGANVDETFTEGEEAVPAVMEEFDEDPAAYYYGALHLYSHGSEGWARYKQGDVSGVKQVEVLEEPESSSYIITNAYAGTNKMIALTFDDGPWDVATSKILDVLEANGARATFFTIGRQIEGLSDVVRRAHALGCQIATHTWDHASGSGGSTNLAAMSPEEQVAEVTDGFAAIESATGVAPSRVMRAPGGNFYGDLVRNLEPYVDAEIGWNVDTQDWSMPGVEAIYQAIMSARPGQVVLLHDGGGDRSQTVEAVQRAVPELKKQGYQLVTIDELIASL